MPAWVPRALASLALVLAAAVGIQRGVFSHPGLSTALVLVAALPWCAEAIGVHLPKTLWSAGVVGSVFALLWFHPVANDFAPFFLVLLAGTGAAVSRMLSGGIVALAGVAAMSALQASGHFTSSGIWIFAIAFAWFFGAGFRWQLELLGRLRAAQAELAEKSATEERQRIAHEVHDVIAHSLSITMLHLTAARLTLQNATGPDTSEAIEALVEAERAGRQAMSDIRHTIGVLAPSGASTNAGEGGGAASGASAGATAAALPGVHDISELVASYRAAGLDVEADIEAWFGKEQDTTSGEDGITAATSLALYRICQESLANAAKHEPGSCVKMSLRACNGTAHLRVANTPGTLSTMSAAGSMSSAGSASHPGAGGRPVPAGPGLGIRGMRSRAESLGGALRAGMEGGSWVVEARLPLALDSEDSR